MSVDFSPCEYCGTVFCECGPHETCSECFRKWCSRACASENGLKKDEDCDEYVCDYCRGDDVSTESLLFFMLEHYKISIEEVKELYKASST